jgi:hypothetical protein
VITKVPPRCGPCQTQQRRSVLTEKRKRHALWPRTRSERNPNWIQNVLWSSAVLGPHGIEQLCGALVLPCRALLAFLCNWRFYSNVFSDSDFLGLANNRRVSEDAIIDDASMMSRRVPGRRKTVEASCSHYPVRVQTQARAELGQRLHTVLDSRKSWTLRSRLGIT